MGNAFAGATAGAENNSYAYFNAAGLTRQKGTQLNVGGTYIAPEASASNIKNNGVCIERGNIIYQVSSFVPKEITGCIVNQNNRIINLTDNKCEIKPNLYIDSFDVEASHSALIGKFSDEEMFYIQSRGIDYNNALNGT